MNDMNHKNDLYGALAVLRDEKYRLEKCNVHEGSHESELVDAISCVTGFCRLIISAVKIGYDSTGRKE